MSEMPIMSSSSYASQVVNLAAMGNAFAAGNLGQAGNNIGQVAQLHQFQQPKAAIIAAIKELRNMSQRRIVQVLIADPNDNIPIDQCLLYKGEQKLTDATDQELFFEIDVKSVLDKHNETRVKVVDKKVKERTEYLEPAKIRDLKMVVVTVATF